MALEGPQVAEAAAAVLAAVGRGPAVDPLVGVQVPQLLEAPATLRAGVGTLTWRERGTVRQIENRNSQNKSTLKSWIEARNNPD